MKRVGNLYHQIAEQSNLELAFWKAQRGKSGKADVVRFRNSLKDELTKLQRDFERGSVKLGDYHYFLIRDPKERMICAASFRERVIHHAIINICENTFEKFQIFDSYACRKGKGVDACLKRAQEFCRTSQWYLKLDVHKYFDSIHHKVLKCQLNRRFKDAQLLDLFTKIIDNYETEKERGLPIGNLSSQYFANLYLGFLDHEAKETLKIKHYIRYMDDILIFSNDKHQLLEWKNVLSDFLKRELLLEFNPDIINKTSHGIPFLSYLVYEYGLKLSLKAKRRFTHKIKSAMEHENAEKALPLLAFVKRAESQGFRRKIIFGNQINSSNRVNRGGSWNNNARNCRAANRNYNAPENRNNNLGFRLALVPAQVPSDGFPVIDPI